MGQWPSFNWQDPFLLEEQLLEEEKSWRDKACTFTQEKLAPRVVEGFRHESFDPKIIKELGQAGFLGMTLPWDGKKGASYNAYGLVAREIERVDSGYRSLLSILSGLIMMPIFTFGSEAQKEKYLPGLKAGDLVGSFGLTEPDFGSNPAGMQTRAIKCDGGWRLTGEKYWIGCTTLADLLIVWAKDEEDIIRGFLLEAGMEGLQTNLVEGKFCLRAIPTGDIIMKDVFVRDENRLPLAEGIKAPFHCLNYARYSIAWGAWGAAEDCWHRTRDYVLGRSQFDKPLASHQLIQYKLANMQTEISLGLQSVYRAGQLLDQGKCAPETISLIKRNSARKALEIARMARDMHGGMGIIDTHHIIRHLLNLEVVNTYEGTEDIHALILGRAQTGIQAFF